MPDSTLPPSPTLRAPARLAALADTGLAGPAPVAPDPALDRVAALAARVLGAPTALVSLVDADRQRFPGCVGLPGPWGARRETGLSHSFCQHVVDAASPFVVRDARRHALVCDNLAVDDLGVAAYLGVPLVADGQVLGSLCVIDHTPRAWTPGDVATLEGLAQGASAELALRAATGRLARREAELADLLDHTEELVCRTGPDGRLAYVNAAWRRALGYPDAGAAGRPFAEFVAPEDRGRYLDAARRLVRGQPVRDFEAVLVARDGRRVACRGWAVPQMAPGPDGRPACVGVRAGYRDVTAERQAEAARARLGAALDASPDFAALVEPGGRLVYLNRAGRHLVGLPEDADVALVNMDDLHPDAERARMWAEAVPAARRDGAWSGETVLLGAGGHAVPVALTIVVHPSAAPGGPAYHASVVARDLRERAAAEAALRASEARFRGALDASLDAFHVLEAVRGPGGAIEDFTFAECNARGAALYGMVAEDLVGQQVGELFPVLRGGALLDAFRRVAETGAPWEGEYQTRDPRSTAAWLWLQVVPLAGAEGVAVTARDVTARKRAEGEAGLLHAVTRALGTAPDADAALRTALEVMCRAADLPYGEAWVPGDADGGSADGASADGAGAVPALAHGPVWHTPGDRRLAAFAAARDGLVFAPGEGLPGRAARSGAPAWIADVTAAGAGFAHAAAARSAGVRSALAVPVLADDGGVVAVLAFHTRHVEAADPARVALLAAVGAQVGAAVRQKLAEAARRESEARFRGVLENLRAYAVELDARGRVTFANDALLAATGWAREEVIGGDYFARFVPGGHEIRAIFDRAVRAGGAAGGGGVPAHYENEILTRAGDRRLVTWDNVLLRDPRGRVSGVASVGFDVTAERRLAAERERLVRALAEQAERDELTGLYNRRGFAHLGGRARVEAARHGRLDGVCYVDLDRFKQINDAHGHAAGDEALGAVARVLRETAREADICARLGGDEFAVYAAGLAGPGGARALADRLAQALESHNRAAAAAGRPWAIGFSVGAVEFAPGEGLDEALARADAALYGAKAERAR